MFGDGHVPNVDTARDRCQRSSKSGGRRFLGDEESNRAAPTFRTASTWRVGGVPPKIDPRRSLVLFWRSALSFLSSEPSRVRYCQRLSDSLRGEKSMSEQAPRRPGGRIASRPLHFIWLADGSGSMRVDGKIEALNQAIREAIPYMRTSALENPHATVFVNAIRIADEAH